MIEPVPPGQLEILLPFGLALLVGLLLPFGVLPLLRRLGIVDVPGPRSSHTVPTVRGMGLASAAAAIIALAVSCLFGMIEVDRSVMASVVLGMIAAGLLGWMEDYRGLAVRWRAGYQLLIGLAVTSLVTFSLGTPAWWIPVGTLAIAGYINVVNFMDGINGISGLHGLAVGAAYAYTGWTMHVTWLAVCGAAIAGAYLAFLPWNLAGKRVFMGDTGSYFLGGAISCCAVGAFLSDLSVEYLLSPLLIYLADTGFTLVKRIYRGEPWYQPHRQHVYQRLIDCGLSHMGAAGVVTAATVAVTAVSILSLPLAAVGQMWMGVLAVAIVVLYLCLPVILRGPRKRTV